MPNRTLIVILIAAGSACATSGPRPPSGVETTNVDRMVELDIPRSLFPAPGLCRIIPTETERGSSMVRSCDGIEHAAPLAYQLE